MPSGARPATEPGARLEAELSTARASLLEERDTYRADGTRVGERLLESIPDALGRLSERLPLGVVLVSGTNGKTTTTRMIASLLEASGLETVTNRIGSNQSGGVAAELVASSLPGGGMRGDIGVFEVDELWLERVIGQVQPSVLVLTNLFRDQLDRLHELDLVAARWARIASQTSSTTRFVLCADDARLATLLPAGRNPTFFGIDDDANALPHLDHGADPAHCPRCDERYHHGPVFLAHLGRWRCPGCGMVRPAPHIRATAVRERAGEGVDFLLHTPHGTAEVSLRLQGRYHVYNALAAAAAGHVLGVPPTASASALCAVTPAFGRGELVETSSNRLRLLLAKNPTGLNEVLRLIAPAGDRRAPDALFLLNDSVLDARDVSWIWDADLESIAPRLGRVVCGGTRATEMALRIKYAGTDPAGIVVSETVAGALDAVGPAAHDVPVIANYSAMLDVRDLLVERGHAERVWR